MTDKTLRRLLGLVVAGTIAVVLYSRQRLARANERLAAELLAASEETDRVVEPDDYADAPAVVQRYFETVLEPGRPYVRTVRADQRGTFRLGGPESGAVPLRATQHYTVEPPGFVWDATIDVFGHLPARVVDAYLDGEGFLRGKFLWTIPVVDVPASPEMDEGELLRYLVEAVWFPTALLPTEGVWWEAIDERSARATIRDGDTTASAVFHFDDAGYVERVTAERYRQDAEDYAAWTGTFRDYAERDGLVVPTAAEVAWEEEPPYWRAEITAIDYR